jgi:hypothetical protein
MTKSEIIDAITHVGIPQGSRLTEHATAIPGVRVSLITQTDASGLELMAARMHAQILAQNTAGLSEVPSAELFVKLHKSVVDFTRAVVDALFEEELEAKEIEHHKQVITRLRGIALKLGIQYEEPEDPLLKQ